MEPKQIMKKTIKHLLDDLDHIARIIRAVEKELNEISALSSEELKILEMKEKLEEVHARLDGVHEFILACQQRATAQPAETEDVDIWL